MQSTCIDGINRKVRIESEGFPSSASPFVNHATPAASGFQTSSAISSIHQPFPNFPSFAQFHSNQDIYRSLWPSGEMNSSMDSSSMPAIAAATVAAAASWWSSRGLLPFFPPALQTNAFSTVNRSQSPRDKMEDRGCAYRNSSTTGQQAIAVCPERLKDFKIKTVSSNPVLSSSSSSSDSEIEIDVSNVNNLNQSSVNSKKAERSSCGSNTTSSSEIETDATLKTNVETKDEAKQVHFQSLQVRDFNDLRARSSGSMNMNESWKEVSQEGRLAFLALFAREILPQTFSLQHVKESPKDKFLGGGKADDNGFFPNKIGCGNLKLHRTGFKPYKRCSVEVDQDKSSPHGETCNKRICVGEASSS